MKSEEGKEQRKYTFNYADIEKKHEDYIAGLRQEAAANPEITPEMLRVLDAFWEAKVKVLETLMLYSGVPVDSIKGWIEEDTIFREFWNAYREGIVSFWWTRLTFNAIRGNKESTLKILEDLGTVVRRRKGPAPSDQPMPTADQLLDGSDLREDIAKGDTEMPP